MIKTVVCLSLSFSAVASADENQEIRNYLRSFHAHKVPAARPQARTQLSALSLQILPRNNDSATNIVDGGLLNSSLESLDRLKLTSAKLVEIPWADSYWPTYKGMIGIRYGDPQFPDSKDFRINSNYILSHSAESLVENGNPIQIDQLSPAEKYDLLVGDSHWSMTKFSWAQGQNFFDANGFIPGWMGICHGWAAASHMQAPVAHHSIKAKTATNKSINFYPSDVKALQSMLWANASPAARFVGAKCSTTNPDRNQIGRITNPDCLDNNPATFHLVLTNQLGVNQRSFVMDATYDAEVWNFPVFAYNYKYFNPQTLEPSLDLRYSMVPVEEFTIDKFKSYRLPETRFVVGIVMDDTYVIEIEPNHGPQNSSPQKTVRHYYDLELDANDQIIGGEWYMNFHPDFIWTYAPRAQARTAYDDSLNPNDWGVEEAVPASWREAAQRASSQGQPLLQVINGLLLREPH